MLNFSKILEVKKTQAIPNNLKVGTLIYLETDSGWNSRPAN